MSRRECAKYNTNFCEAEQKGAILVLDEVDVFIIVSLTLAYSINLHQK